MSTDNYTGEASSCTINELINKLQDIKAKYGDIPRDTMGSICGM